MTGSVSAYVGDEEGFRLQLVAGSIVVVVVVLVVIIVFTVMFLRSRSNDECNKKQPSDCDTLEYRNGGGKPQFVVCFFKIMVTTGTRAFGNVLLC
jgi:heme/copper-type cytochrome/quinol oxidase subunit 2